MAEAFGLAAGAVNIAQVFTTVVDCFGYVQLGRNYGRDFQTDLVTLRLLALRLSRWGTAVRIYDDPTLGNPTTSEYELKLAKETLFQILVLFSDSEKKCKKFRLGASAGDLTTYSSEDIRGPTLASLDNKMREMVTKRQKGTSLLKKTSWALYDKETLERLVEGIATLLENLERLFPGSEPEKTLVQNEVVQLSNPDSTESLQYLQALSYKVDSVLRLKATEAIAEHAGHTFGNVIIEGGKTLNGNFYSQAWNRDAPSRTPSGDSHVFETITVKGGIVQNGDRFGKDIFDD